MSNCNKYLTDEELISAINHSSRPYIIVEGPDDVVVYRWILADINCVGMLEPRGGCNGVMNIFNKREKIRNKKVVYICDKDTLVYDNQIPEEYEGLIYTNGYSIENDLYHGRKLEEYLFEDDDCKLFSNALNSFLRYYACELEKFKNNKYCNFSMKPEAILNCDDYSLKYNLLNDYSEPSNETIEYLKNDYDIMLRGHSLFKLIRMILHRPVRKIKYECLQLYEICYKFLKSDSIINMQNKIKKLIS